MPVIFISRGTMSGVHLLLDYLHNRTGIRCISREDLVKDVNKHGEIAARVLEKLANAHSAYDQFSELRWPYMILMRKALLEEIRDDNIVYHGYSSHLLLPVFRHFVRIRIEAPLEMRVTMTMRRLSCNEEKAREYITNADEHRVRWARFMYAHDIRNTMLYDLVLNLDRITLKAACGILECLMVEKDFQVTPESRAEVERLYLATKIEESLVTDPRTAALEIHAKVQNDGIRLIGPYIEDSELTMVIEIAQTVSDTSNVQYNPGYASRFDNNGYFRTWKTDMDRD
ncbi:MAG TPA: cytidylate kinase family protein [Desulfobacterales bacterium]|nr:cytidylate kinase family protein [Desulfobacterales bacterium]